MIIRLLFLLVSEMMMFLKYFDYWLLVLEVLICVNVVLTLGLYL